MNQEWNENPLSVSLLLCQSNQLSTKHFFCVFNTFHPKKKSLLVLFSLSSTLKGNLLDNEQSQWGPFAKLVRIFRVSIFLLWQNPVQMCFVFPPATNIKMPDIAGTKISNWTWLLIFGRFLFPLGFVHKTISFLSPTLNNDGDDDQLWKELGQWPLSGFRTAQLLFYERWW